MCVRHLRRCFAHKQTAGPLGHAGILKGVRREQLAQAGAAVEMQPGSLAVMQKAVKAGIPV